MVVIKYNKCYNCLELLAHNYKQQYNRFYQINCSKVLNFASNFILSQQNNQYFMAHSPRKYFQSLPNLSLFNLILILMFTAEISGAKMPTEKKCFGDFIFVVNRCVPCKMDQIAQNNKCIKLSSFNYGSNKFNLFGPDCANTSSKLAAPCQQYNPLNTSQCIKCINNYELMRGKCIEQGCRIYSETLNKCLDNLNASQLQLLNNSTQPTALNNSVYIVGSKNQVVYSIADTSVALNVNNMQPFNLNLTKPREDSNSSTNSTNSTKNVTNPNGSNPSGWPCLQLSQSICTQCAQGFLLNSLLNQCIEVNTSILLPKSNPQPNIQPDPNKAVSTNAKKI